MQTNLFVTFSKIIRLNQLHVHQPLRAFHSDSRRKRGNFQLLFLKGRIFVNIFKKAKEHLKILKTTSGSSSSTDLSNNITFSQSQSHATVRLMRKSVNSFGTVYISRRRERAEFQVP
jgi:hypothetical protein